MFRSLLGEKGEISKERKWLKQRQRGKEGEDRFREGKLSEAGMGMRLELI
jgi:hypothetical protein